MIDRPRGWESSSTPRKSSRRSRRLEPGRAGRHVPQFGVSAERAVARFSPFPVYNKEIRAIGSMAVLYSFECVGELSMAGVLHPGVVISNRFPLNDYLKALDQFRAGVGRKIQVRP